MDPLEVKKKAIVIATQVIEYECQNTIFQVVEIQLEVAKMCIELMKMNSSQQRKTHMASLQIGYLLDDFNIHFRMKRSTFEALQQTLGPLIISDQNQRITVTVQLLIVIWILATPDSFRSVAERFHVSKGTAHYIYVKVIRALCNIKKDYIKWPCMTEIENNKRVFAKKSNFPNVVGCIDGMHVPIKAPKQSTRYYNRKQTTSLILQGVCNHQLEFIDVYFGEVGSLHDSRVFANSPLSEKLRVDSRVYLGSNGHLLGDAAYPLRLYLMTPFRDNGHLTDEELIYNFKHSLVRSTIERTFGLLKGKWRRLKYLDACVFEYIVEHVLACCVLHNFVLQQEKGDPHEIPGTWAGSDGTNAFDDPYMDNDHEATEKRHSIAALLYDLEYCYN